jgi:D-alanine-D-alanine ligase
MNIAFTYNVKHNENYSVDAKQDDLEFDSWDVINGIFDTITGLGHKVIKIEADLDAFEHLRKSKGSVELVFNIAEGLGGDARESQIPLFCEMLEIPYTHSSPTTHALKIRKHLTKQILSSVGVDVPKSIVTKVSQNVADESLKYPLIVKPHTQGSSKGIFNDSVVKNSKELALAIDRVLTDYDHEALVEEYIEGREFTVALLGNPPKLLPIIEQRFDFLPEGFNKVAGYELKWIYEENLTNLDEGYYCPPNITQEQYQLIEDTSLLIWRTLEVKDCARIDYRMTDDKLYFLEINTLPGIIPNPNTISYLPLAARKSKITYSQLIETILKSACDRYQIIYR